MTSSSGRFETEEAFVADDRCVVLWTYAVSRAEPDRGIVRGVDVFRVEGPKVAEKLSYMKSDDFVQKLGLQIGTTSVRGVGLLTEPNE